MNHYLSLEDLQQPLNDVICNQLSAHSVIQALDLGIQQRCSRETGRWYKHACCYSVLNRHAQALRWRTGTLSGWHTLCMGMSTTTTPRALCRMRMHREWCGMVAIGAHLALHCVEAD